MHKCSFSVEGDAIKVYVRESVFSSVAKNIVESCMNGYNGTIFAYVNYCVFQAGNGKSFLCKCSFIEIYNEQIFDLLDSASAGLFLREHIKKGVFVDGAVEQVLSSAAEAYQVLTMGWRNRRVASTSMNRESSRSHAVFTITVESMEKNNEVVNIRSSLLNLVDLAGSERQKDTHAEGLRLKEAGAVEKRKNNMNYMNSFLEAMLFWEKSEDEKKNLLEKIAQLEDLCAKKEKFIQSNKMIVKFREDHIIRLERLHKEAGGSLLPKEQDALLSELREELQTLREQMEQHPRIAKYAMENHNLREENKRLRSLQSVKKAQEIDAQTIAELEKAFLEASAAEKNTGGHHLYSTTLSVEGNSLASEKLKARLLQTQSELASSKQEYEEFKELTKKKHMELESELQSLQKANQHLENILEATKAHKRREVSHLHKLRRETLQNITTPTKAYQLRSRLVPRISPEILDYHSEDFQCSGEIMDDILKEPVPPEMNEQAHEAIAEELKVAQEQLSTMQTKLDEEESKNIKLQQHVNKLEHHSAQIQELLSSERNDWSKERQELLEQIKSLEKQFQDSQSKTDILKSEVCDLRIVLQSADKELSAVKLEYSAFREKQEKEMSQLSGRHMDVQFQLDSVRELLKVLEKAQVEKPSSEMVTRCEQQEAKLQKLEQELAAAEETVVSLKKTNDADKEVVTDLMRQIQELRSSINHKTETIDGLTRELEDINCKYNLALAAKEESKGIIEGQEKKIEELRETLERRQIADSIELDKMTEEMEKRKNEYEIKMKQIDCFMDSSSVTFPQCPKTPPNFDVNLAKLLETHEQEIADRRASAINLEHLVHELNEERRAKNDEILRLKEQLNELDNLRLEMQILVENNRKLQSLVEAQRLSKNSDQKQTDVQYLKEKEEEIAEERLAKEMDLLRKQVDSLVEENGKLLGHQNLNQKIQYLVKLKKDYAKLTEVPDKNHPIL
ncbi:kinesin-like protein kif15 [Limosa lapponica baueri]|uniref:Kinesin-like protein kif15 n=1 Tax=Limosa lapponica baueri TaxID=1758121 RepID=A0A2I0TWE1_LIMLA|nr:kinesin-like protein kif15 [Limosa lapponica baueri]